MTSIASAFEHQSGHHTTKSRLPGWRWAVRHGLALCRKGCPDKSIRPQTVWRRHADTIDCRARRGRRAEMAATDRTPTPER